MGFAFYYRSTRPVTPTEAANIERAADELIRGHTWLSCEPVCFDDDRDDGHMFGGSKPNFQPDEDDVAAAKEALPDGTTKDLFEILRNFPTPTPSIGKSATTIAMVPSALSATESATARS